MKKDDQTTIKELTAAEKAKLAKKSVSLVEKGNFCRYFSTMIRSGAPILQAVETLSTETQNKTFAHILQEIKNDLKNGKTLGQSLRRFPQAFDNVFLTVISAGEESGTLDRSLDYLGKQLLADYYLVQKVKGALLYPLIIVVAMMVIGFVMLGGVLPRIAKVFLGSGLPIPAITRIIFEVSLFFERNLFIILPGFIAIVAGIILFFFKGRGKAYAKRLLPRIPLIRKIFSDLDVARFGRILGTLLESGVPIVKALKIASATLTLPKYTLLGSKLEAEISKGASIKEVLHKQSAGFPKMVTGMIAVGEETGTLEKVLFDIANFYDQEVDASLKNFTTVLEPVLMVSVGLIVGLMALSIIAPIYSLVGSLEVR